MKSFLKIGIPLILIVVMFGLFNNNVFSSNDKSTIVEEVKKGALLVDVRTAEEFEEGSVEGAVNIPLHTIPDQLGQFQGKPSIIVFCRSGNRSAQAKAFLDANGIQNVINGGTWNDVASALEQE